MLYQYILIVYIHFRIMEIILHYYFHYCSSLMIYSNELIHLRFHNNLDLNYLLLNILKFMNHPLSYHYWHLS